VSQVCHWRSIVGKVTERFMVPGQDVGDYKMMPTKITFDDDLDALFRLPLSEFTAARNELVARLKKAGNREEAERVKALSKPSVSAWAVNQLYWKHGDAFKDLIAIAGRFGRAADMRKLLAARSEAISSLTHLASDLLSNSGHNPSPDLLRRITTTLEALSTSSSLPDAPCPGRLTADVDPPGFESMAALIPGIARSMPRITRAEKKDESIRVNSASRVALKAAEEAFLTANAHAKDMERRKQNAEERFENAKASAEEARKRLQIAITDTKKAAKELQNAERDVEKARKEFKRG